MVNQHKRDVTELEFSLAWNNASHQNLMGSVCCQFRKLLPQESLDSAKMVALWKCLSSHNENYGQQFTSSLWRFIRWECLKALERGEGFRGKFRGEQCVLYSGELPEDKVGVDLSGGYDALEEARRMELRFRAGERARAVLKRMGVRIPSGA